MERSTGTLSPIRGAVNSQICYWCQSIFTGPLSPAHSSNETSIRIDCWECLPATTSLQSSLGSWSLAQDHLGQPGDLLDSEASPNSSSTEYNMPGTLYMNGYEFVHMSSGFEVSYLDGKEIAELEASMVKNYGLRPTPAGPSCIRRRYGTHHGSVISFWKSLQSGCRICHLIRAAVSSINDTNLADIIPLASGFTTYGVYYFPQYDTSWIIFHLGIPYDEDLDFDPQQTVLHLYCRPEAYFEQYTRDSTDDEECSLLPTFDADIVSSWIEYCDGEHHCNPNQATNLFYPTRLLSIGSPHEPTIKLVLTEDSAPTGNYATLSYCWGSGPPVRLLLHLLGEFQEGIVVNALPKTLREAVELSREVGFEYLWIDSLCIIQDSREDWSREASQMSDIYSNSYCNIAATHSQDCQDGLFFPDRNPMLLGPIFVQSSWDGLELSRIGLWDPDIFVKAVEKAPLNKRGWVLQERFLSPRTIHFAKDQLFWECYNGIACEVYSNGLMPDCHFMSTPKRRLRSRRQSTTDSNELWWPTSANILLYWSALLKTYSTTNLTKDEDTLLAISGIARMIADSDDSQKYVVGLWANHLPSQLLWSLDVPGRKTTSYLGPSWSWASISGNLYLDSSHLDGDWEDLIKILSYDIDYMTEDIFGGVRGATLQLSGRLYPSLVIPFGTSLRTTQLLFEDDDLNSDSYSKPVFMDVKLTDGELAVYCLPVLLSSRSLECLVLQANGQQKGYYSRVGRYTAIHQEDISIMGCCSKSYIINTELYAKGSTIIII